MINIIYLAKNNFKCFLEFRRSYNNNKISILEKELCFVGNFENMIKHLKKHFSTSEILEMIQNANINVFKINNETKEIIFKNIKNIDKLKDIEKIEEYQKFENIYIKIIR